MQELTLETLFAVFEEIFGRNLFWGLVIAAVIIAVLFLGILWRERGLEARRLVRSELWAPVGIIAAIAFVFYMTNSGLSDMGGPIDIIVLILIGIAGAIGLTIVAYVVQSLFKRKALPKT